jgi:hypothetical protein
VPEPSPSRWPSHEEDDKENPSDTRHRAATSVKTNAAMIGAITTDIDARSRRLMPWFLLCHPQAQHVRIAVIRAGASENRLVACSAHPTVVGHPDSADK